MHSSDETASEETQVGGGLPSAASGAVSSPEPRGRALGKTPGHYKVICVSLYTRDIDAIDRRIEALKAKGFTKSNRSLLIRVALAKLTDEELERELAFT